MLLAALTLAAVGVGALALAIAAAVALWAPTYRLEDAAKVIKASSCGAPREVTRQLLQPAQVSLSVVVPAYNEAERILPMLEEAVSYLRVRAKSRSFTYEIIVVDDGSTDGTFDVVSRFNAPSERPCVRAIGLHRNMGKGFAVKVGVLAARGERILMCDADGATKFSDLEYLEDQVATYDCAFGSRNHLRDDAIATRAWYRTVLMLGFHFIVAHVVGTHIGDTQCGFKLFSRASAQRLFPSLHIQRWAFDIELVTLCQLFNFKVKEVAVTWTEIPGSKLNAATATVQMFRDIVLIRMLYATRWWKPA